MKAAHELVRRRDAAQATLDRFRDRPLVFGAQDCVRMVAFHLRQLGYRPALAKAGSYHSYRGAKAALKRAGYATLADAVDALGFARIAPAEALVGDVLQLRAVDELGALTIYVGNGRVIGFHEQTQGAVVMQPTEFGCAWRVPA